MASDIALALGEALSGFTQGLGGALQTREELKAKGALAQQELLTKVALSEKEQAFSLKKLGIEKGLDLAKEERTEQRKIESDIFSKQSSAITGRLNQAQRGLSEALSLGQQETSPQVQRLKKEIDLLTTEFQTLVETQRQRLKGKKEEAALTTSISDETKPRLNYNQLISSAKNITRLEELEALENIETDRPLSQQEFLELDRAIQLQKQKISRSPSLAGTVLRGEEIGAKQTSPIESRTEVPSGFAQEIQDFSQKTGITDPKELKAIFNARLSKFLKE